MNKSRLLTLARHLDKVAKLPAAAFYMGLFAVDRRTGSPNFPEACSRLSAILRRKPKHACKTAACAAGWACTIPSFRRDGFTLSHTISVYGNFPVYNGQVGFEALSRFFDLDEEDVEYLFGGDHDDRTAADEARIIRSFVAAHIDEQ